MANPEHLAILAQGVDVWNRWRDSMVGIRPDLSNADLSRKELVSINLDGADLHAANLSSADLTDANLNETVFVSERIGQLGARPTDLKGTAYDGKRGLSIATWAANLTRADLRHARLGGAQLCGAVLSEADLRSCELIRSNLTDANLSNALLSEAQMGGTILANVDLSSVKGLEEVEHWGPSTIGIDTLFKSRCMISESFLLRAGVPDSLIRLMPSLTVQNVTYHSCLIAYTEADDQFAKSLYKDLQKAGIRCWTWREDAPWGKALMHSIDKALMDYDKLIVVCSEHSLNAQPVIREIERALQKEDDIAKAGNEPEVSFPIRLDDFIFSGWNHYRKADVTLKNVGDFRNWQDPTQYKQAFDRLVRDLST
jgi:TIR domain/Pentapeptide repeats (8 copies)